MSDRESILAALRSVSVEGVGLPDLDGDWLTIVDLPAHFSAMLDSVGGRCETVRDRSELDAALSRLAGSLAAKVVHSELDPREPAQGKLAMGPEGAAPDLASIDLAVVRGEVGVAENAAVWVSDAAVGDRAVLFLAQHVALVVDRDALVSNMHQAYERVEIGASPFGVFISGPSKTADIEQALVIGAHGPRSLTVFLVG